MKRMLYWLYLTTETKKQTVALFEEERAKGATVMLQDSLGWVEREPDGAWSVWTTQPFKNHGTQPNKQHAMWHVETLIVEGRQRRGQIPEPF